MTKRNARKAAKQSILDGNSKQETFDTLKETSKISTEDLAKIVQSIPSMNARKKYKTSNMVLIILLSITILIKVLAGIPLVLQLGFKWFPLLFILPIINILLLVGIATYAAGIHKLVAILTILGVIRTIQTIEGQFEPVMLIDFALAAALIGLGFYLNSVLCPKYWSVKEVYQNEEGQNRMKHVIKFED